VCCMLRAVAWQRAEGPEGQVGVLVGREGARGEADSPAPLLALQAPLFTSSAAFFACLLPCRRRGAPRHRMDATDTRPSAPPRNGGLYIYSACACRRCSTSTSARWSCTTRRAPLAQRSAPCCSAVLQRRTTTLQRSAAQRGSSLSHGRTDRRLLPTLLSSYATVHAVRSPRPCAPSHTRRCINGHE
jgi:hypothetical protein